MMKNELNKENNRIRTIKDAVGKVIVDVLDEIIDDFDSGNINKYHLAVIKRNTTNYFYYLNQGLKKSIRKERKVIGMNQKRCICQRWGIVDKTTGKEIGTLGWYTNSSKAEVKKHAENNGIKFKRGEDIQVVEEQ